MLSTYILKHPSVNASLENDKYLLDCHKKNLDLYFNLLSGYYYKDNFMNLFIILTLKTYIHKFWQLKILFFFSFKENC